MAEIIIHTTVEPTLLLQVASNVIMRGSLMIFETARSGYEIRSDTQVATLATN